MFQEHVVTSSDHGLYTYRFETQVPLELGADVETYGFIKLLDPNNGWSQDLFFSVSTITAGVKTIKVRLDSSADGKVLQWGFANFATDWQASGRHYDNVTFAISGSGAYEGDLIGVPVPLWAYFIIAGLLAFVGGAKLLSRKET